VKSDKVKQKTLLSQVQCNKATTINAGNGRKKQPKRGKRILWTSDSRHLSTLPLLHAQSSILGISLHHGRLPNDQFASTSRDRCHHLVSATSGVKNAEKGHHMSCSPVANLTSTNMRGDDRLAKSKTFICLMDRQQ